MERSKEAVSKETPEFVEFVECCRNRVKEGCEEATIRIYETRNYLVLQRDYLGSLSSFCFVVKTDNKTKELGEMKRGDVMKAASFKAPAKHARGNIFDEHNGLSKITQYGVEYLPKGRKG